MRFAGLAAEGGGLGAFRQLADDLLGFLFGFGIGFEAADRPLPAT